MVLATIQAGNGCMGRGSAEKTPGDSSMRQQHPGHKEHEKYPGLCNRAGHRRDYHSPFITVDDDALWNTVPSVGSPVQDRNG